MTIERPQGKRREPEDIFERLLERLTHSTGRYWRHALAAAAAVVVVLLAYRAYMSKAALERAQTWEELSAMRVVDAGPWRPDANDVNRDIVLRCQQMLNMRWKTDATPWVLLTLGNAQRSLGLYEDALKSYDRLRTEHKEHCASALAAQPRAAALEELGRFDAAALAYEGLAKEEGEESTFWLDAGRAWELARNRQAATQAYGRLAKLADSTDREEAALAAYRMDQLVRGQPMLTPPPPPLVPDAEEAPPAPGPAEQEAPHPEEEAPVEAPAAEPPPAGAE